MFILALKQSLLTASTLIPSNAAAPVNISAPVVSGTGLIGQVLSSTTGTWSGSPSPTYAYQWRRGGTNIAGATASTYTPVFPADNGASITCLVTATNIMGSASAISNAIAVETWVAPVNTVVPLVTHTSGTSNLSVTTGTWTGNPAPTFTYQWVRNGVDVSGATLSTYTIPANDSGTLWTCRVTATNGAGSANVTPSSVFVGTLNRLSVSLPFYPSLRRVNRNYTGSAIRVRRSSDGVEADIGFTAQGDLDQNAVLTHVYSGTTSFLSGATGYGATGVTYSANTPAVGQLQLIEDLSNGLHRVNKNVAGTISSGTQYRIAAIVQRVGASRDVMLELYAGGFSPLVVFRLDTLTTQILGSAGTTGLSGTVRSLSDGRFICEIVFTASVTVVNPQFLVSLATVGTGDTRPYQGNGTSGVITTAPALYVTTSDVNGTVVTAYDQSMNGINATQATAAAQPFIVTSGVVDTINSMPAMRYAASQWLTFTGVTAAAVNAVVSIGTGVPSLATLIAHPTNDASIRRTMSAPAFGWRADTWPSDYPASATSMVNGATAASSADGSGAITHPLNTPAVLTFIPPGTNTAQFGRIGDVAPAPTRKLLGQLPELALFTATPTTADRQLLERNQGAYYGITVA